MPFKSKEEQQKYNKAYKNANKERIEEQRKQYYEAHKERMMQNKKEWDKTHKEEIIAYRNVTREEKNRKQREVYNSAEKHQYYEANKEEIKAKVKARNRAHPEAKKLQYIKARYNLTADEYSVLLSQTGGICPVCKKAFGNTKLRRPVIDHCHRTNAIRGIICGKCNVSIGKLYDDYDTLLRAAEWVKA